MRSSSGKFIMIIIVTMVIPIVGYIMFEISKQNENEAIVEEIYKRQLETMIFSVNQYSTDFISSLFNKIEEDFTKGNSILPPETMALIETNGFKAFSISEIGSDQYKFIDPPDPQIQEAMILIKENNRDLIAQLRGFQEAGYRKLEPAQMITLEGSIYQVLMAVIDGIEKKYIAIGLIEPHFFVGEILSPKMQQIAGEEMIITLRKTGEENIFFATDSIINDVTVSRKMWLFPDLLVGISPKSLTISQMVSTRLRNNYLAIGLLTLLLIIGFTLIIRNINREIRLSQSKSDFVSNVSHELRTPLALISMFAETLMLGRARNKEHEYHEIMYKESVRLTNIVNRILNFSKIEANKRTYQPGKVNLNELLEEIISDYSYHLEQNGFTYEVIKNGEDGTIDADRDAVYEAVVNLIDNAVKYSPDTKRIRLEAGGEKGKKWIRVSDEGVGIPKEKLSSIFEKFYRVSENDIYTVQGTGLGLTIIKHIMDAHDGEIQVESSKGKGSTFTLVFNQTNSNGKDPDR